MKDFVYKKQNIFTVIPVTLSDTSKCCFTAYYAKC